MHMRKPQPVSKKELAAKSADLAFEEHARKTIHGIRSAVGKLVEALPCDGSQPTELARALGIDKTLAWKFSRLIRVGDPFAAANHVPGSAGVQIFLDAARRGNVPAPLIDAAADSLKEFERLIDVHAADRACLEMMLASCARQGHNRAALNHRRTAFRANSFIWGVQAKTQLKTDFFSPAAEPGILDIATVRGFIDLRRIRANVPWVVARAKFIDDDGLQRRALMRDAIDPPADDSEEDAPVALLRGFCTQPLPHFRRVSRIHGFVDDEIVGGPAGNTAATTYVTGEVVRSAVPYYRDEHNRLGESVARVYTPCEVLVLDQIVHEDLFPDFDPLVTVCSELSGEMPPPEKAQDRLALPVSATVEYLGNGPAALHTPDVPRYVELARHVFERLGWDGDRFRIHRLRLAYPPIPAAVAIVHELPERPALPEQPDVPKRPDS
jgi:hypothetical protein